MFSILTEYGNIDFVIDNAVRFEELWKGQKDYANHKTYTKVHHLIIELRLLVKSFEKIG